MGELFGPEIAMKMKMFQEQLFEEEVLAVQTRI